MALKLLLSGKQARRVQVLHLIAEGKARVAVLMSYRSKSARVAAHNEAGQLIERPAVHNGNEGNQLTQPRALPIEELLTPREAEIARFVAGGLSNKQVARKASISEATVKIHLHNAYRKLGIANRSVLAVMVSRAGL